MNRIHKIQTEPEHRGGRGLDRINRIRQIRDAATGLISNYPFDSVAPALSPLSGYHPAVYPVAPRRLCSNFKFRPTAGKEASPNPFPRFGSLPLPTHGSADKPFRIPHSTFCIPHSAAQRRGSSLITTLLVLVVLSTICVAFMQSMSIERSVARSSLNQFQAQLAVEAGIDQATERIASIMGALPYHAVSYTNVGGQLLTTIIGAPTYTNASLTATNYLLSVSNTAIPPSSLVATNSVAINSVVSRPGGWIGSPLTAAGEFTNRECRAPWIYLLRNPSLPHQPDSSAAGYNPYVARFAYWIEDETSKIDVMVAGNNDGPGGGYLKPELMLEASDTDIGAAPLANGLPLATNASSTNNAIITLRNALTNAPPVNSFLSYVELLDTNAVSKSRFYTTMGSFGSQLAGTGRKRVNLNAIVTDTSDPREIASDLDDIIFTISGQRLFAGLSLDNTSDEGLFHGNNTGNPPLPGFGSRFYPGSVTPTHQEIYMKKIAANIRDYIDSDSTPTILDNTGAVVSGSLPNNWHTWWPPQVIGKEALPYLQETAWAGLEVSWSGTGSSRRATLEIDHYLEFFNPNTKNFTAPPGTKIFFSNLPFWEAGSHPDVEIDDFEIDISGVVFPAGRVVVITTNPGPDPAGLILDSSTVVRVTPTPATARRFADRLTDEVVNGAPGFQNQFVARDSAVADNQSRIVISGTNGIFDASRSYGYTGSGSQYWNFRGQNVGERRRFVYSSSLMGNSANGRSGDPRSINEQLSFFSYNSGNQDNTRFYGNIQGTGLTGGIPGTATFGRAALSFVDPTKNQGTVGAWGDYTPAFQDTAATAYAVVEDGPMSSIGELGHLYDPYRLASPSGIQYSRGGGRTLKLGQPDDTIGTAARFSPAWRNAAWRLADVFGVDNDQTKEEIDAVRRGMININSITRDGGMAFRAFLRSFVFLPSPQSDSTTAGRLLNTNEINSLINSMSNYIATNGPFLERGEISQLPYFSGASTNLARVGNQTVRTVGDRGREEIFRRLVELATTRSASFSIYCVGESISETPDGRIRVVSRARKGAIVLFDPEMPPTLRSTVTRYQGTRIYEFE